MLEIKLDIETKEALEALEAYGPSNIKRAAKSAFSSIGYTLVIEIQKKIRENKSTFKKTIRMNKRSSRKIKGGITSNHARFYGIKTRQGLSYWGRFVKYIIVDDGGMVSGISAEPNKGDSSVSKITGATSFKPRPIGKFYGAIFRKMEYGETYPVTKQMRGYWGFVGRPLRKETTQLNYRSRPAFGPVFSSYESRIPGMFREKFFDNLARYVSGKSRKQWESEYMS